MSLSAVERSQCCKHASFAQSAAHMIVRTLLLWVLISLCGCLALAAGAAFGLWTFVWCFFDLPCTYAQSGTNSHLRGLSYLPTQGPSAASQPPNYLPTSRVTAAKNCNGRTWRAKFGRTRRGCVAVGTRPLLRFPANDFCEFEQMSSKIKLVVGMPDEDMGTFLQDVFGAELGDFKASSLFATGSSLLLFIPALLPRCEVAPNYLPTSSCRTVGRRPTYLPPWVRYRLSL